MCLLVYSCLTVTVGSSCTYCIIKYYDIEALNRKLLVLLCNMAAA